MYHGLASISLAYGYTKLSNILTMLTLTLWNTRSSATSKVGPFKFRGRSVTYTYIVHVCVHKTAAFMFYEIGEVISVSLSNRPLHVHVDIKLLLLYICCRWSPERTKSNMMEETVLTDDSMDDQYDRPKTRWGPVGAVASPPASVGEER